EPRATIGRSEENVGLFGREECDRASAMALVRYRQYALDVIGRSRLTSRRVSEERVDRREPRVASADGVAALFFEVRKKRGDARSVDVVQGQVGGPPPEPGLQIAEQQAERVAICRDRVAARIALLKETLGEEPLQERCEQYQRPLQSCSSRLLASASSSGAAWRYQ